MKYERNEDGNQWNWNFEHAISRPNINSTQDALNEEVRDVSTIWGTHLVWTTIYATLLGHLLLMILNCLGYARGSTRNYGPARKIQRRRTCPGRRNLPTWNSKGVGILLLCVSGQFHAYALPRQNVSLHENLHQNSLRFDGLYELSARWYSLFSNGSLLRETYQNARDAGRYWQPYWHYLHQPFETFNYSSQIKNPPHAYDVEDTDVLHFMQQPGHQHRPTWSLTWTERLGISTTVLPTGGDSERRAMLHYKRSLGVPLVFTEVEDATFPVRILADQRLTIPAFLSISCLASEIQGAIAWDFFAFGTSAFDITEHFCGLPFVDHDWTCWAEIPIFYNCEDILYPSAGAHVKIYQRNLAPEESCDSTESGNFVEMETDSESSSLFQTSFRGTHNEGLEWALRDIPEGVWAHRLAPDVLQQITYFRDALQILPSTQYIRLVRDLEAENIHSHTLSWQISQASPLRVLRDIQGIWPDVQNAQSWKPMVIDTAASALFRLEDALWTFEKQETNLNPLHLFERIAIHGGTVRVNAVALRVKNPTTRLTLLQTSKMNGCEEEAVCEVWIDNVKIHDTSERSITPPALIQIVRFTGGVGVPLLKDRMDYSIPIGSPRLSSTAEWVLQRQFGHPWKVHVYRDYLVSQPDHLETTLQKHHQKDTLTAFSMLEWPQLRIQDWDIIAVDDSAFTSSSLSHVDAAYLILDQQDDEDLRLLLLEKVYLTLHGEDNVLRATRLHYTVRRADLIDSFHADKTCQEARFECETECNGLPLRTGVRHLAADGDFCRLIIYKKAEKETTHSKSGKQQQEQIRLKSRSPGKKDQQKKDPRKPLPRAPPEIRGTRKGPIGKPDMRTLCHEPLTEETTFVQTVTKKTCICEHAIDDELGLQWRRHLRRADPIIYTVWRHPVADKIFHLRWKKTLEIPREDCFRCFILQAWTDENDIHFLQPLRGMWMFPGLGTAHIALLDREMNLHDKIFLVKYWEPTTERLGTVLLLNSPIPSTRAVFEILYLDRECSEGAWCWIEYNDEKYHWPDVFPGRNGDYLVAKYIEYVAPNETTSSCSSTCYGRSQQQSGSETDASSRPTCSGRDGDGSDTENDQDLSNTDVALSLLQTEILCHTFLARFTFLPEVLSMQQSSSATSSQRYEEQELKALVNQPIIIGASVVFGIWQHSHLRRQHSERQFQVVAVPATDLWIEHLNIVIPSFSEYRPRQWTLVTQQPWDGKSPKTQMFLWQQQSLKEGLIPLLIDFVDRERISYYYSRASLFLSSKSGVGLTSRIFSLLSFPPTGAIRMFVALLKTENGQTRSQFMLVLFFRHHMEFQPISIYVHRVMTGIGIMPQKTMNTKV